MENGPKPPDASDLEADYFRVQWQVIESSLAILAEQIKSIDEQLANLRQHIDRVAGRKGW